MSSLLLISPISCNVTIRYANVSFILSEDHMYFRDSWIKKNSIKAFTRKSGFTIPFGKTCSRDRITKNILSK